MEREQLSSAKLELESSRTFSHLATQVTQLKQAMAQLADAVVGELDDIRAGHNAWQSKMERYERVIEDKVSAVDALCADKESCLLYTSPSPRDQRGSRMPSSA